MRTRTIVHPNSGVTQSYARSYKAYNGYSNGSCKTTTYNDTKSFVPYYDVKVMTDIVTTDYKKRISRGQIINNPMDFTHTIAIESLGSRFTDNYKLDSYGCKTSGWFHHSPMAAGYYFGSAQSTSWNAPIPVIDVQRLKDIALTNALSKVDVSEASVYATIGELEETVGSIVSVLKGTTKFLKTVRSRKWYKLREYAKPKELMARWMEVRYGLRPLVFECSGYVAALAALNNLGSERRTFRSGKTETGSSTRDIAITSGAPGEWIFNGIATCHREVTVRAGCIANVDITMSSILGLDQPIQALYELTTLSFVLDWFFNVGKTISTLVPRAGVDVLASWLCVDDIINHTFTTTTCELGSAWSGGGGLEGRMSCMRRKFTRTANPSKPILPSFDVHMSLLKTIDLGIILKQIFL